MSYKLHLPAKRWPGLLAGLLIAAVLLAGGAAFRARHAYIQNLKPVSASQRSQQITIPLGTSVKEIGAILQDAGLIRASWAFEWYVRKHNARDKLQAGTYSLRPNQSVEEIITIITQGKIKTDLVTILPGQRIDQIEQALINSGFSSEDVKRALDPGVYANHPALADKPKGANLEGYLYPESFQRTADTKAETVVRASLDQMQKYLTPELRTGIVKQGLTVYEGVILASIVEQEVSKAEDKPKVAQVFLRRLREGKRLESDATSGYGAILAGDRPSLTYESAYNTYTHNGLPPTPISNVSQASLQAVASPAPTDWLYFVSGDDGITHFSNTIEEHEALTRQYCTRLCGR